MSEIATFGNGCFWCTEAIFRRLKGVVKLAPGFSGGTVKNPAYREVVTGRTGHAEVLQIHFDPTLLSYSKLLEVFFATHDPTTLNRQGNDVGTQYRSVIFYHDLTQKKQAEDRLGFLEHSAIYKHKIVTEISAYEVFYPAEKAHLNYYENHPQEPYCHLVIQPKLKKFFKLFSEDLSSGF